MRLICNDCNGNGYLNYYLKAANFIYPNSVSPTSMQAEVKVKRLCDFCDGKGTVDALQAGIDT